MSYRRPLGNEPYWQAPSPYQRPPHDEFNSSHFDMEDFLPYNGVGHRHQPHSSTGQGYLYDPQFQGSSLDEPHGYRRLGDTDHTFNQGHGWTQPAEHDHSEKLPEFRPILNDNHAVGQMHDRRMGASLPQTEHTYPSRSVLPQRENPQLDHQQATGAPWRAEPQQQSRPSSSHQDPPPSSQRQTKNHQPLPSGMESTDQDSSVLTQTEQPREPIQDKSPDLVEKNDSNDDEVILHPVLKVPVKRKPNGTYELVAESSTKKKAKKASAPPVDPTKPKKLQENVGDGCYCENEAKAIKGEPTIIHKRRDKRLRNRFMTSGPIPNDHNQEETPIIGLDFVTRVVVPDQEESEDLFECSLCDKKDLMASCIYTHVLGRNHRKAYIRKLKPNLADQYSNIANVYDKNGQLQRRQTSDLTALLSNIIKIAASRDGPGEMQIRLCNEKEGDDAEDYGVDGYNSDPEDFDDLSPEDQGRSIHANRDLPPPTDGPSRYQPMPLIPRAPYSRLDSKPLDPRPPKDDLPAMTTHPQHQPSNPLLLVTRLLPRSASPEAPQTSTPPVIRLPSHALSPETIPPPVPPTPSSHPPPSAASSAASSAKQSSPRPSSSPTAPPHKQAPPAPPVTRLPPKLPPASEENTQTASKRAPADLPSLSDDQLRCYCSDVFIAQEYRRRFGDPTKQTNTSQPTGSQQNMQSGSIHAAESGGASVETLLKTLSDTMVHNEDDASMAMELTRALTQATLKYRLREKNFALQGSGGKT